MMGAGGQYHQNDRNGHHPGDSNQMGNGLMAGGFPADHQRMSQGHGEYTNGGQSSNNYAGYD